MKQFKNIFRNDSRALSHQFERKTRKTISRIFLNTFNIVANL